MSNDNLNGAPDDDAPAGADEVDGPPVVAGMSEFDELRTERYAALEAQAKTMTRSQFTRRSFLSAGVGAASGLAAYGSWKWLQDQPVEDQALAPLRSAHEFNESVWRRLFREDHLARTFDPSESSLLRVNGLKGMANDIDLSQWSLDVLDRNGDSIGTHVMADIQTLPKVEMTVEHKCVEGWSHVVTWGGTRFSDFYEMYADLVGDAPEFVGMRTPDLGYYVGIDFPTMMHPQTLLAWELQGEPLNQEHGAPLRIATPLKYGIKQIKRIGVIQFTDEAPRDYWAERGYDYYSHL